MRQYLYRQCFIGDEGLNKIRRREMTEANRLVMAIAAFLIGAALSRRGYQ